MSYGPYTPLLAWLTEVLPIALLIILALYTIHEKIKGKSEATEN